MTRRFYLLFFECEKDRGEKENSGDIHNPIAVATRVVRLPLGDIGAIAFANWLDPLSWKV